jgi:hypothetical protein
VPNTFRDTPKETIQQALPVPEKVLEKVTKVSRPGKKGVLSKALSSVFSGTFLTNEKNLKHLPYVLFLTVIAILYIANGFYADDKIRQVNKSSNQLKELRSEYISTKSELMFASKQSEVAKSALAIGLKEPLVPPIKILTDSVQLYSSNQKQTEK